MGYYSSLMINCGQFSKGFKTSQNPSRIFVLKILVYRILKQLLILYSKFINNLISAV